MNCSDHRCLQRKVLRFVINRTTDFACLSKRWRKGQTGHNIIDDMSACQANLVQSTIFTVSPTKELWI